MDLMTALTIAIPLIAGFRYFGREFWPQLIFAVLLTTYLQAVSLERDYGDVAEWWRIAIFASINALSASAIYALDKRFKFTHWEKIPD